MPSPKERKPLADGQFYDKLGRRRSLGYKKRGPKRRSAQREIDGDFSGNNELLIYIGLTRGDEIIGVCNAEHVQKSHALADKSGNPKVWTDREYNQEFLRSLIPSRQ